MGGVGGSPNSLLLVPKFPHLRLSVLSSLNSMNAVSLGGNTLLVLNNHCVLIKQILGGI